MVFIYENSTFFTESGLECHCWILRSDLNLGLEHMKTQYVCICMCVCLSVSVLFFLYRLHFPLLLDTSFHHIVKNTATYSSITLSLAPQAIRSRLAQLALWYKVKIAQVIKALAQLRSTPEQLRVVRKMGHIRTWEGSGNQIERAISSWSRSRRLGAFAGEMSFWAANQSIVFQLHSQMCFLLL